MKHSPALVLSMCLATCLGLASCNSAPKHPPVWQNAEVAVPSENVLWAVSGQEMQYLGFPVGSDADPAALVMRSGWHMHLAPFRGQGYREKAEVRFTRVAPERFKLEVRVAREDNMDLKNPIDPRSAEWKEAPDSVDVARVLMQRIRARLGDKLEVGTPTAEKTPARR